MGTLSPSTFWDSYLAPNPNHKYLKQNMSQCQASLAEHKRNMADMIRAMSPASVAVWTAEALNTALELLADAATPQFHPLVGQAKDVAAGAVLLSAVGSIAIGLLILGPHIMRLWQHA